MPIVPATFQLVALLFLALTLVYLSRLVRRRPAADWAFGWFALVLALAAVQAYLVQCPRLVVWPCYLLAEWAFLALLIVGCRDFATGQRPRLLLAWIAPPALLLAFGLAAASRSFNELFRIHAGIMAAGFGVAHIQLRPARLGSRAAVVRVMRGSLAALTVLFASYVVLFGLDPVPSWLAYSSFVDALLENALGMGMLLAITGEVQRALEDQARIDPLTGLLHVRDLPATMTRLFRAAQRRSELISVVYLDVDDFKIINDTHGHQHGDEILRAVGAALRQVSRQEDACFRYGGDEFCLVLPNCGEEEARERYMARVRAELREGPGASVVLSAGVVQAGPAEYGDPHELIREADRRMYVEKRAAKKGSSRASPADVTREAAGGT